MFQQVGFTVVRAALEELGQVVGLVARARRAQRAPQRAPQAPALPQRRAPTTRPLPPSGAPLHPLTQPTPVAAPEAPSAESTQPTEPTVAQDDNRPDAIARRVSEFMVEAQQRLDTRPRWGYAPMPLEQLSWLVTGPSSTPERPVGYWGRYFGKCRVLAVERLQAQGVPLTGAPLVVRWVPRSEVGRVCRELEGRALRYDMRAGNGTWVSSPMESGVFPTEVLVRVY